MAALRRAAHRAFIASESFFRPAAVMPPLRCEEAEALLPPLEPPELLPLRDAQRARAASAILARVAADIGLRRPSLFEPEPEAMLVLELLPLPLVPPPPPPRPPAPKSELRRFSNASICSRSDTASRSLSRDRSIAVSSLSRSKCNQVLSIQIPSPPPKENLRASVALRILRARICGQLAQR